MKTIAIAALLTIFVATPAMAARSQRSYDSYDSYDSSRMGRATKMYIGVSGGQASNDITAFTTPSKSTSTAYSVFAGYSFNEYIAAELAYTNFGTLVDPTTTISLASNAGSFSLVGSLPMGKAASLFVKAGYASTTTELTVIGVSVAPTETLGAATYGGGIQFNAGNRVGIRLGYDVYKIRVATLDYNSNVASLGLMYKF